MSSTAASRAEPTVVTNSAGFRSKLPRRLRAVILLVLTVGLKSALWSAVAPVLNIGSELKVISKTQDDLVHPLATFAFKAFITWFGWRLDYDYIDIGALTLIANAPFVYLLSTFYNVSLPTVAAIMNIEVISIALPTYLLRPQSKIHDSSAPLRNRFLLESFQVQTSASLLAVGVFVVTIWSALKSGIWTPFLVTHFSLTTLDIAHSETPVTLAWKTFTAGIATKTFLLNPSIGAVTGTVTPVHPFDPATATLPETVKANVWFFGRRTRALIRQTTILSVFLLANTVQRSLTLKDAEAVGAVGYAGVWILAAVVCAGWYAWIGDTESE